MRLFEGGRVGGEFGVTDSGTIYADNFEGISKNGNVQKLSAVRKFKIHDTNP